MNSWSKLNKASFITIFIHSCRIVIVSYFFPQKSNMLPFKSREIKAEKGSSMFIKTTLLFGTPIQQPPLFSRRIAPIIFRSRNKGKDFKWLAWGLMLRLKLRSFWLYTYIHLAKWLVLLDFQIPPKYYFECKAINVFLLPFLNACTQMDIIKNNHVVPCECHLYFFR